MLNLGKCCRLRLPAKIKVPTSENARTGTNYAVLTKLVKVQHKKKPVLNLKSMQIVAFEQTSMKFIKILVP